MYCLSISNRKGTVKRLQVDCFFPDREGPGSVSFRALRRYRIPVSCMLYTAYRRFRNVFIRFTQESKAKKPSGFM